MNKIIAPSLLACDFANLQQEIEMVNSSSADWFHIDVMDGMFVPNISFGMPVIKAMKKHTKKPMDVHLMIENPDRYISDFKNVGADILTVHIEACNHLNRTVANIKEHGMKAGVALNPHTPVSQLEDIISKLDLVLIMSVNPGFGGQSFIENTFSKVRQLKQLIVAKKANTTIEVDGGVNDMNIASLAESGCDAFVLGSHIFKSKNPLKTIDNLKNS
jgi:ribulose-phosphate 3-epimerase